MIKTIAAGTPLRLATQDVVNVAAVAHRSPFRYAGGKTWLVPTVRQWLRTRKQRPRELAEPFAGGAIVSLSALFENLVNRIVLVEKDEDVAAVWKEIIYGDGIKLARDVLFFDLTEESAKALIAKNPKTQFERAFATIVRNRVQRGGILAPGASFIRNGENGKGIRSRWYPDTLRKRIEAIVHVASDISVLQADGIEFIRYNGYRSDTAFFIDPPYTIAARRLYKHSELNHRELFAIAAEIAGDVLMTYDESDEIRSLASEFGFQTRLVRMKNTHHEVMNELLVARDFSWLND